MTLRIEPHNAQHLAAVIDPAAALPGAASSSAAQQPCWIDVYQAFYPMAGTRVSNRRLPRRALPEDTTVWVAIDAAPPVSFYAVKLARESSMGRDLLWLQSILISAARARHRHRH